MNIINKFHHWRRKQRWNKQYKRGRWDSLQNEIESPRYFQIIEDIKTYGKENPTILDIGCGSGVLNTRMLERGYTYAYFLGLDFSKISIDIAKANALPKSDFKVADVLEYEPTQNFDIIIFNEAFYYIYDKEKSRVLERMLAHLNQGGIIINSIYREGTGCWHYFKEHPALQEENFTTIKTKVEKTYWKIGAYRKT